MPSLTYSYFNIKSMDEDVERAIKTETAKKWLQKYEVVGPQADIRSLSDVRGRGVRSVYGIAGVGKSFIVKYVYNKQVTDQRRIFKKFGWVDVSHPFNLRDFSWSLLLDFHSGSLQHDSMQRIKDPIQDCRELLRQNDCLIVIDGLQSTEEWDLINAAFSFEHDSRSLVIVIANKQSIATYCSKFRWSIQGLEIDDAVELFKRRASKRHQSFWPSDPSPAVIEEVKSVLYKCGGLPKVIIAVADVFASGWRFNNDYFMQALATLPAFGRLRNLFSWVHSYFDTCPDSIKPCIFYLSIFPVNHKIRRRRLVRRWVAEGYSMDTREMTADEDGEKSFAELCKLNMIQVPGTTTRLSYFTRIPLYKVNGFFREYIISRSMDENLVFALEGHCSLNSQRTGRHLTIGSTWDRDRIVYDSIDFSHLRSLTVFGEWEPFFISGQMRLLRVLDLEDASSVTDGDVELMVKQLPRLKFLSLRGLEEITRLPDSFGTLRLLQTLDIRHTSIVKIPASITNLQKLQHIRAGTAVPMDDDSSTVASHPPAPAPASAPAPPPPPPPEAASASSSMSKPRASTLVSQLRLPKFWTSRGRHLPGSRNGGIELPRGMGKMTALHNISVIDVSIASGRAILEELKNLRQLRKLGVSGIKRENCQELCSVISSVHAHLTSLSVWLDKNQAGCLDAISLLPKKLHSLKLYGHVDKLPAWIKLLPDLRKLKLQMDMITQDEVDLLTYLTSLNTLCLSSKEFQYGELRFRGVFVQLQVLEITCNSRLEAVTFEPPVMPGLKFEPQALPAGLNTTVPQVMPRLEVLKISCCNVSSLKFSGLKQQLGNLSEVSLSGSYDDKVKQHLQSQLEEHPMKPVFKVEPHSVVSY